MGHHAYGVICIKRQLTNAHRWVSIVVAIGLTHNAARSRHAIARVGQAVVFHYRAGYGRVGREPEATVVDDGRLETVHGCDGGESEKRNASKKERKKNGNDENNTEKKTWFLRIQTWQRHELLTFAARRRSVPATIDVADQVSPSDDLIPFVAGVGDHAQIVASIIDQLVGTVGDTGRHAALYICTR